MGNHCCAIHGSSTVAVWTEDDWGSNTSESMEKKELLGGCKESSSTVGTTGNQVRIRISKKELEELLKRVEDNKSGTQFKKMKANQVLQNLIDKSDHFEIHNQRSWMPALQSIPEVN
ncbi:uncharacterized protein LOC110687199 [Chenopodium quinoa]|uniref:uncharacterized protein LOC110687199 n=1 Tax=Chenopodium quinoa TaxID=63459 RepID=UPI000B7881F9|nr:uncharacterized protein LOC110687199 [Chenopodium quinoa]